MASQNHVSAFAFFIILVVSPVSLLNAHQLHFDAIYQFGDSLADTGNLKAEGNLFCGTSPYGETFFKRPTGRCSDGRVMIDFIAEAFHLPYLNPSLAKGANFSHGVNFAVSGSTALDSTTLAKKGLMASPYTNSSLSVQMGWFRSYLKTICTTETDCKQKLGNALFMMGEIGGNDFNYALIGGPNPLAIQFLYPEVIRMVVNSIKEVISVGAKYVVVPGNFPIGCVPLHLSIGKIFSPLSAHDRLGCVGAVNAVAIMYNKLLQQAICKLQNENPGVTIVYADYYGALMDLLQNAESLEFEAENKFKACCGNAGNEYNIKLMPKCGTAQDIPACPDPNKLISWDGVHMTERAYQHMAQYVLKDIVPKLNKSS